MDRSIKIIPFPSSSRGRPSIYPFKFMEVGDSFLIPCEYESR